jgi:hypothetical protein
MMKNLILIAIVFAGLLATGCTTTYLSLTENNKELIENKLKYDERDENVGAELTLSLMNGTEINGELLSIRDSTITLSTKYAAAEDELDNLTYPITTVRNDEIQEMTIEGSNYVLAGLGIGIAAGTGIGYLVGLASEPNRADFAWAPEFAGGVLGFGVGALAGPIVG